VPEWFTEVVILRPNGSRFIGTYDGYGRVDELELIDLGDFELFHRECWERSGKPDYQNNARNARDQGFFFPDESVYEVTPEQAFANPLERAPSIFDSIEGVK
jgi:hypothetical protein